MVKKLYLFRLIDVLSNNDSPLSSNFEDGVFKAENWPLLGLERSIWKDYKIRTIRDQYPLKPFEVRQKKFEQLLLYLDHFNMDLIQIKFSNELYDEEHEKLRSLISINDTEGLLDFISEQRFDFGNDIEEVTFKDKNKRIHESISLSRNAVLTAPVENEQLENLISSKPIGLLSGAYVPLSDERSERC